MERILLLLLAILITIAIFTHLVGEVADKQTSRIYARAHLVETKNEATKGLLGVMLPYVIIAVSLIAGAIVVVAMTFGLISVTALWINRPQPPRIETHIIERHTMVMLRPGQSPKDYYRQLEKTNRIYYMNGE